ncbi:LysM peptidoglycan-binding domain-containing protein [Candidatus Aerophobetes bacterium]|nr:LysM peptidoglycan-binding domain-containing protein [Candidatus Aerophobetes bacterium]
MLEEERKTPKKGRWLALIILILVFVYVVSDGWFTNKIEPHTVVAVYEPGGVRALVNKTDKPTRMWKWPRILGTSIGVTEEPIKDEARAIASRFAMYTTDKVTGNAEDKEYVQAYVVDIEMKVKDWQKFFQEIDLDEINKERREAGPFVRLVKDRFEVVVYLIENIIRHGEAQDRFGKPLRTEEGYPAMNLSTRVNYAYFQLINRRNFLIALSDRYHLKTPEKIKKYLKEEIPWYWFAGPDTYEFLAQQYKDIQERILSPYSEDISPEASQRKFTFGEDRLKIYRQAYQAYRYEKSLIQREKNLKELERRQKIYSGKEKLQKTCQGFKKFLKSKESDLRFVASSEHLQDLYASFIMGLESNIIFALRQGEVESIKKAVDEARKKFDEDPLKEVDRKRAEEIQKDVKDLVEKKLSEELSYFSSQELFQFFNNYLAESNLQDLSSPVKEYAWLLLREEYLAALSPKVEKALKFLDIEIAKEFYLDIKTKLETEKIDFSQISSTVREYITGQQYLFQDSLELIPLLWQEEKLEWEKIQWEKVKEEELIPFFKYYSQADTELALDIRRVTSEENEALWEAAIEEVLGGEDITELRSFFLHKIREGDTLAKLAKKYKVNWQLVSGRDSQKTVWQSLSSDEDKMKFDQLLAQGIKTGNLQEAYEFTKNVPLKVDEIIVISRGKEFTPQWFEKQEEYRKKREAIANKYIYSWIEKFAPRVIEEYVPVSPWIDHIERTYGVKIIKIKLHIGKDSMFTKDGQPKEEYYDLYYSEIGRQE